MEETGRVRRGYFVEGMGGAQFAVPGAVDRLRSDATDAIRFLAATDPANPFGATLDWPKDVDGRIGRIAGAYVGIVNNRLAAFLDGRRLTTFDVDDESVYPLAASITGVAGRHRRFSIEVVDGQPVGQTAWAAVLGEHGFAPAVRGITLRR
jgi:ATP-dependent Lhr-like helicase